LDLQPMGWTPFFEQAFEPYQKEGYSAGRVALEHKHIYRVYSEHGDLLAEISGKLTVTTALSNCKKNWLTWREKKIKACKLRKKKSGKRFTKPTENG
jgi:hypothetical protein